MSTVDQPAQDAHGRTADEESAEKPRRHRVIERFVQLLEEHDATTSGEPVGNRQEAAGYLYEIVEEEFGTVDQPAPTPEPPHLDPKPERRAVLQGTGGRPTDADYHAPGTISWEDHEEVWELYAERFGTNQSAERINERGGFGWSEVVRFTGHAPRTYRGVQS